MSASAGRSRSHRPAPDESDAGNMAAADQSSVVEMARLEPFSRGEELRIWRPEHLKGVELMTAINSNRLWRFFHDRYAVCVIPPKQNGPGVSEIVDWQYRGRHHVMRPGTVALMEPGEVHANKRNYRGADFFTFFLDPTIVESAAGELSAGGPVHWRIAATESPRLRTAVCRIYAALGDDLSPLEQDTRLAAGIRALLESAGERRPVTAPAEHPGIRRVRDYLHAHLLDAIRLDELAAVSGLSRYHVAHTFTRTYGLSPHAYHNQLRIAFVRRQLRTGMSLSQVESGFFDQSHLVKHFKRAMGITPKQYASAPATQLPPFA